MLMIYLSSRTGEQEVSSWVVGPEYTMGSIIIIIIKYAAYQHVPEPMEVMFD